ncbi:MAG: 50S ribosomal protein L4 [Firmicutes bacterium]|nr:50S ribosomal protein L4 [Erysipelotrichaceae bacterium]MDD6526069.1 50S ribosomal protein L4 [Bacillota bacterium]MDD7226891.1 50S ribosomal protein L4 [Bacillota bacterium]MDY4971992.1 50S ribosomal protein L4 [Erysipelotrichaceae bacterium]
MPQMDLYNLEAKVVGSVDLADAVFNIEPNNQAIYDAVLLQQASMRQGTHKTKTRTEVSGGGKKPFRQKGTGRARQGSTRATQWRGGGIAFGPTPRSYGFKLNRKVRRLALRSALSAKVADNKLTVLDSIKFDEIKTKKFVEVMNNFKFDRKTLFVVDITDEFDNAFLSMRNLPNAMMLTVETLNVYDIVNADQLVITKAAAEKAKEVFA